MHNVPLVPGVQHSDSTRLYLVLRSLHNIAAICHPPAEAMFYVWLVYRKMMFFVLRVKEQKNSHWPLWKYNDLIWTLCYSKTGNLRDFWLASHLAHCWHSVSSCRMIKCRPSSAKFSLFKTLSSWLRYAMWTSHLKSSKWSLVTLLVCQRPFFG